MHESQNPAANHLLAALAHADWQRWKTQLARVDLKLGQVLYAPGSEPMRRRCCRGRWS